jgi:hypothetical protein
MSTGTSTATEITIAGATTGARRAQEADSAGLGEPMDADFVP